MTDGSVVVRSRRAAVVGGVWLLTALVLFVSGIMLLVDDGRVWLELPLAVPAFVIGLVTWRSRVVFGPSVRNPDEPTKSPVSRFALSSSSSSV